MYERPFESKAINNFILALLFLFSLTFMMEKSSHDLTIHAMALEFGIESRHASSKIKIIGS